MTFFVWSTPNDSTIRESMEDFLYTLYAVPTEYLCLKFQLRSWWQWT
jgi:hypothetical protein